MKCLFYMEVNNYMDCIIIKFSNNNYSLTDLDNHVRDYLTKNNIKYSRIRKKLTKLGWLYDDYEYIITKSPDQFIINTDTKSIDLVTDIDSYLVKESKELVLRK